MISAWWLIPAVMIGAAVGVATFAILIIGRDGRDD